MSQNIYMIHILKSCIEISYIFGVRNSWTRTQAHTQPNGKCNFFNYTAIENAVSRQTNNMNNLKIENV